MGRPRVEALSLVRNPVNNLTNLQTNSLTEQEQQQKKKQLTKYTFIKQMDKQWLLSTVAILPEHARCTLASDLAHTHHVNYNAGII